jgi:thiosulfate dehydrogenase (quinone) large subunit
VSERQGRSTGASGTQALGKRPITTTGWNRTFPPPRALALSGWALLPLRAFLGFTFCFAGLQKLANPTFFNDANPSGIHAQLIASARTSPLHGLMSHLVHLSTPIGVLIALAELAVGLGTLLGLLTRIAALGGLLLSFTLFLSVSFHSSPYYTGADIVFFFAWIPLILAGSGGVLSLDGAIRARRDDVAGLRDSTVVPVPFGVIQQVCGNYREGSCAALSGRACEPHPCPFLLEAADPTSATVAADSGRRTFVLGAAAVGVVGAIGLAVAGTAAGIGRLFSSNTVDSTSSPTLSSTPTTVPSTPSSTPSDAGSSTTTTSGGLPGTAIGSASAVPVGGAARFTVPSSGDPGLVLQPTSGTYAAYDAVCPHAGCTVGWSHAADLIVCPCHGSEFNPDTGDVVRGPAPHGLKVLDVKVAPNGQLYLED